MFPIEVATGRAYPISHRSKYHIKLVSYQIISRSTCVVFYPPKLLISGYLHYPILFHAHHSYYILILVVGKTYPRYKIISHYIAVKSSYIMFSWL
jgi:hypothetical protein